LYIRAEGHLYCGGEMKLGQRVPIPKRAAIHSTVIVVSARKRGR